MTSLRNLPAILFLFIAFAGGAAFLYLAVGVDRAGPDAATVLPEPRPLPSFSLVDQAGAPFTNDSLAGRWSVLFFGFTHCPDICPATLQQLAVARQRLAADGRDFPEIILVSVDPERDTPEVLADYVAYFDAGITGVTGTVAEVSEFAHALGIFFAKSGDSGGDYSVDHSAAVLVVNENAEWYAVFSAPHSIDDFVHDLPILTGST
jgi:protein SCO1/2